MTCTVSSGTLNYYTIPYVIQCRRFLLNSGGRDGERGTRAYNDGLAAEPLVRDQGAKPPEAERKLNFDNTITRLILHLSKHFGETAKKRMVNKHGS